MRLSRLSCLNMIVLLAFACRGSKPLGEVPESDKLLSFQRTPCFGFCPVYSVTLLKDGTLYFDGQRFVPKKTTEVLRLTDIRMRQIRNILSHPVYLEFEQDSSDQVIMDISGFNLIDFENKRFYEFGPYHPEIPDVITALTDRIDEALKERKLLYSGENNMIRKELIFSLEPGMEPERLLKEENMYELTFLKKIGQNYYLYEITTAESQMEKAIQYFKKIEGVKEVQINHELERRER